VVQSWLLMPWIPFLWSKGNNMSINTPVHLRPALAQPLAAKPHKILTKAELIALLEQAPDDLEIRVDIKLSDIARAKKCIQAGGARLEFELTNEVTIDETGINLNAWVHPDRFANSGERITGVIIAEREVGLVKWFNDAKGLGFIVREDGQDVFVHYEAIRGEGFRCLRAGSEVEYTLYQTSKGLQAQDVITLSEPAEEEMEEYNESYA